MKILRLNAAAAALCVLAPEASRAAPYASALTVTGDDVSFVLNEAADSVKVVFDGGASTLVIGTSPEPAGTKTFSRAGHASFVIEVEKVAPPGWRSGVLQQLSSDTNDLVKFANGRGVAVNRYADTGALFGRIYVSLGGNGTAAPLGGTTRPTSEGIYVLNADMTATSLGSGALTGTPVRPGAAVTPVLASSASANSPFRVTVGPGGDLFISDWSDANGSIYKTNGNVSDLVNLLPGPVGFTAPATSNFPVTSAYDHGSIAAVAVTGSEALGDLKVYAIDEDLQGDKDATGQTQRNSIWEWSMAGGLPLTSPVLVSSAGIGFASQTADIARGNDGRFYKLQRRDAGNEAGVYIVEYVDGVATVTNSSRDAWRSFLGEPSAVDPFLDSVACDISDDNWLALMRFTDNAIHLVKIVDGTFDFSTYILLYTSPTTANGRDICFDAAGNLYTLSSGQNLMRVYSRGGHTLAKTSSANTFEITEPTPPVPPLPIDPYPVVTGVSVSGSDLLFTFRSRIGKGTSQAIDRTTDLELGPWSELTGAAAVTITGTPPNYTARTIGTFTLGEPRYFFRARRK